MAVAAALLQPVWPTAGLLFGIKGSELGGKGFCSDVALKQRFVIREVASNASCCDKTSMA